MHFRKRVYLILMILVSYSVQQDKTIQELCKNYDDSIKSDSTLTFNGLLLEQYLDTQTPIMEDIFYKIYRIYHKNEKVIVKKLQRDILEKESSLQYFQTEVNILNDMKENENVLQMKFCVYQYSTDVQVKQQIEKVYIFQENFEDNLENMKQKYLMETSPQQRVDQYKQITIALQQFIQQGFVYVDLKLTNIFVMDDKFEKFKFGNFVAAQKIGEQIKVGTPLFLPPFDETEPLIANEQKNVFSLGIILVLIESKPNIRNYKNKTEHQLMIKDFLRVFEEDSKLRVLNQGSKGILQTIWEFIKKILKMRVVNSFQDLMKLMLTFDESKTVKLDDIQQYFDKWIFLRTNQQNERNFQLFKRSDNFRHSQEKIRQQAFKIQYLTNIDQLDNSEKNSQTNEQKNITIVQFILQNNQQKKYNSLKLISKQTFYFRGLS